MVRSLVNALLFFPILLFGCFGSYFPGNKGGSDYIPLHANEKVIPDAKTEYIVRKYGPTIQKYSSKYGFDWRLILAIMKLESQFHPDAESHRGAEGFMQIMPVTQAQIAEELGMEEDAFDHPHINIRGGIYYLSKIYATFGNEELTESNRLRFSLAAYNAGTGRVADARTMARYVNDSPNEWSSVRNALSLLSRKYSSLHRHIWASGRPSSGYFKQWKQTTNYVDTIMSYYVEYCKHLPSEISV